jgi:hypothetical protein
LICDLGEICHLAEGARRRLNEGVSACTHHWIVVIHQYIGEKLVHCRRERAERTQSMGNILRVAPCCDRTLGGLPCGIQGVFARIANRNKRVMRTI